MLKRPFGNAFTFIYYPPDDPEFVPASGQSPTIYLFSSKPSDSVARTNSDSSAIQTITSWTLKQNPNRAEFTVAAISDPQDGTKEKTYWSAINYKLVAAGQNQLDLQAFLLIIPDGQIEDPTPSFQFIKDLAPTINKYYSSDTTIETFIRVAEMKVRAELWGMGYQWELIGNPVDLRLAIAYKTLTDMMLEQITEDGDRFSKKFEEYRTNYHNLIKSLKIEYDADDSKDISDDEKKQFTEITFLSR